MEETEVLKTSSKDDVAYRKIIQDKIREELEKLQAAEEAFRIKVQEENKRKKEREEMKLKVLEEIEAIKKMEIEAAKELERKEEERKKKDEEERIEMERRKVEEEEREAERKKIAAEMAEVRRLSEETRRAAERREQIRLEAERHKRELEEARMKAFEAERQRLMALEEEERQLKLEAQKKLREEEERKIAASILERKRQDEELEKKAREEMEAQRLRDQEELRLQMLENKKRKFQREEEERIKKEQEDRERMSQPRRKKSDNPLLMRFEEMSQQQKKQEEQEANRAKQKKTHPAKFTRKQEVKAEAIRQSKLALASALSKGALNNIRSSSKELVKALSKELLKVLSKESLKSKSRSNLHGKSGSKENLKRTGSVRNLHQKSNNSSKADLSHQNGLNFQLSKKEMQNYLISHVLFDGKEDVQSTRVEKGSQRHLASVTEDQTEEKTEIVEVQSVPDDKEDLFFEAYKQEMEKYLSFFGDTKEKKVKKSKKQKKTENDLEKKPILNIGTIRNQFESLASPEIQDPSDEVGMKPRPKRVGKLEAAKMFESKVETEQGPVQKKEYVPVVIDKDAFERTMGRFEFYKDEEEERAKKREEQKRKKLEEERLRMEREREERERREREEEEEKRRIKEEEERKKAEELEKERRKESMLTKIGNFFTGKSTDEKEAPPKEIDPAEQERLRRVDIHQRIQHELEKIREQEEIHRQQMERERKKEELKRQIQSELDKIRGLDSGNKKSDNEDMPLWMKMVYDPEARKRYRELKQPQSENVNRGTSDSVQTAAAPLNEDQIEEATPKWVQMVMERQEALRKAKEIDLNTEAEMSNEKSQQTSDESNQLKRDNETVQAVMDFLDGESNEWLKDQNKSKLMARKKESVVLPNVSSRKTQFENMESNKAQPTSPTSPTDIGLLEKVKLVKQQLLQPKEKDSIGQSKVDVPASKKCSTLKSMFERSNSTNEKDNVTKVKPPPKKSIIQVVEAPSIDAQLSEKKRELASRNKWSYKEKSLRDLHHIIANNNDCSISTQLAEKVEKVLETSEKLEEEKQRIEQEEIDEYNTMMEKIHQFVNEADKMGKTDQEVAFHNTLNGYLKLIEEEDEYRNKREETKKSKKKNIVSKTPKKLDPKMTMATDMNDSASDTNASKSKVVKKLDLSRFESSANQEDEQSKSASKKVVTSYNCEIIKDQLEKKTAQPEVLSPIQRKMKLVNIENPKSIDESLAELKAKRANQWKWKQKTISELQDYINKNQNLAKTLVGESGKKENEVQNQSQSYESLVTKQRQLEEATLKRDQEFEKFLAELEEFTQEPAANKSDEIFRSSVRSYIELIDHKNNKGDSIKLPEIVLPSRLDDLKSRITEKPNEPSKAEIKKQTSIKKIKSFFSNSKTDKTDEPKDDLSGQILSPGKATKLKKMFEEKPKVSNLLRTRSEIVLNDKPVKRSKQLIEVNPREQEMKIPLLSRRNSIKGYFSNSRTSSAKIDDVPSYKAIERRLDAKANAKSKWDEISDPDERRRAILAKHGFRPHYEIRQINDDDDIIDESDTIPEHILKDEVLYRKYMKQQISIEDSSSSRESSPEQDNRDNKAGSVSSLLNIFNVIKKSAMKKSAQESRQKLEQISKSNQITKSELDLTAIPGSCANIRTLFESQQNETDENDDENDQRISKSKSCANLQSIWTNHLSQTQEAASNKETLILPNIRATKEILLAAYTQNKNFGPKYQTGELDNDTYRPFTVEHSTDDDFSPNDQRGPLSRASISALRERLLAPKVDNCGSSTRAKKLFESGALTSEAIRQFTEQRSEVSNSDTYDFGRQKRKLISKFVGDSDDVDDDENEDENQRERISSELEALRSSGQVKNLFRLQHGRGESSSMRRSLSSSNFETSGLAPTVTPDLDEKTMAELSMSNSMIRAMFESSAPKYKFGGSNENVDKTKKEEQPLRPVMRPSQKTTEERKWVLDTINKYFDVIVEEEEEEPAGSIQSSNESLESMEFEEDDDDDQDSLEDSEDEQKLDSGFKSTAKMRGLLETAMAKVISKSQINLESTDQRKLVGHLKENLGSQINLRRQMSVEKGLNYA